MASCSSITTMMAEDGEVTSIAAAVHPDIIQNHILTKLDGPTLASMSSTCSQLHNLSSDENLWKNISISLWPSTSDPHIHSIISSFPSGYRSFFSDAFPAILHSHKTKIPSQCIQNKCDLLYVLLHFVKFLLYKYTWFQSKTVSDSYYKLKPNQQQNFYTQELISAVDIHFEDKLLYSKVWNMETVSEQFRSSPFKIDLLGNLKETAKIFHDFDGDILGNNVKETINIPMNFDGTSKSRLHDHLKLSWIIIDPAKKRALNMSSLMPISITRNWLTKYLKVRYATVMVGKSCGELVQCAVVVTCEGVKGGEMRIREVSMKVLDMDGNVLNGKDGLVILGEAMERGRKKVKEGEEKERYEKFLETMEQRRCKKHKRQKTLQYMMLVASCGIFIFMVFFTLIMFIK